MNRIWNRKSHIFGSKFPGAKVRSTLKKDDHDSYYYKPPKKITGLGYMYYLSTILHFFFEKK